MKFARSAESIEIEARAWELRCRGWSQQRIASELDRDQGTISRALGRVERRTLKQLAGDVERFKARQSALLDHIVDEMFQAWERSKKPQTSASERTTSGLSTIGKDGNKTVIPTTQTSTEVVERDGEPAYIDRTLRALQDLRRLWGIDAPPAERDVSNGLTVADLSARLKANATRHDEIRSAPAPEPAPEPKPVSDPEHDRGPLD